MLSRFYASALPGWKRTSDAALKLGRSRAQICVGAIRVRKRRCQERDEGASGDLETALATEKDRQK